MFNYMQWENKAIVNLIKPLKIPFISSHTMISNTCINKFNNN
jgi:hypothetical protein